jgi:hypothetical protein
VTYPSSPLASPIVPRPREGHRRRFSDADKQRILEEAAQADASAAQVARRYGIAQRLLRRWKQELATTALAFVTVQVTDVDERGAQNSIEAPLYRIPCGQRANTGTLVGRRLAVRSMNTIASVAMR